ncbi:uncharacterized protein H6S33_008083 [Morchella sextelata]|uniref:uncharacterized protein n=1 Tax=Morchella sextelata TaxID=1174677 RepID=UPI001D051FD4|nr:uncharacterized protein H6S33_008083 [Morchella sextelata]KAH0603079.1 hypothetical protein H6S33_008083 [Morchella sextelata]
MGNPDARKELFEKISTLSRILVDLDSVDTESEAAREGVRAARDALLSMMASPKALMNTTSAEETTPPPPVVVLDGTVAGSQENQATILDVSTEDEPVHPALRGLSWSFLDPIQGEPAPTSEPDEGLEILLGYLDEKHPDTDDPDSVSLFSIGDRSHCTLGMGPSGAQDHQPTISIEHVSNMVPAVEPISPSPPPAFEQGVDQGLGGDSSAEAFEAANLSFNLLNNSGGDAAEGFGSLNNDWINTALDLPFDPDNTEHLGLYGCVNLELTQSEIEAILDEAIAYSNHALGPLPGSASAPASEPFVPGLVQTHSPNSFTIHNGFDDDEMINRNNLVVGPGLTGNTPGFSYNTVRNAPGSIPNFQTPGNTAHDPIVLDLDDHQPVNNRLQASPANRRGRPYANSMSINGRSITLPRGRSHAISPTTASRTHSWTAQRPPYSAPRIPSTILPQYVATTTRDYSLEGRLAARMRRRQMEMHIERIDEENRSRQG